jgi:hypothetical protein
MRLQGGGYGVVVHQWGTGGRAGGEQLVGLRARVGRFRRRILNHCPRHRNSSLIPLTRVEGVIYPV